MFFRGPTCGPPLQDEASNMWRTVPFRRSLAAGLLVVKRDTENSHHSRSFYEAFLGCSANYAGARRAMACSFSAASSATRLQALEAAAAAAGGKNARIPLKASVSPALRSLGSCKAARQEFEGATQDPSVSVSSARTQLDLLEQLTSSPTSDGIESGAPAESRPLTTIREQLSALYGERGGEFTLPMGKKLKEGLKALNSMTVSQKRNIKRQALLTKVSGRNDSVFFATVGAFVLVPPLAILAIAVLTGYVQLLP